MKRKFFSLMVAACAALFSFTGLTGCGGGGSSDGASYPGYLTYHDFVKSRFGVHVAPGSVWMKIIPDHEIENTYSPEGGFDPDESYTMMCSLYNRNGLVADEVQVDYWIKTYEDAERTRPASATMTITAGDTGTATEEEVLAAFGGSAPSADAATSFKGKFVVYLVFQGDGGIAYYSITEDEQSQAYIGGFKVVKW